MCRMRSGSTSDVTRTTSKPCGVSRNCATSFSEPMSSPDWRITLADVTVGDEERAAVDDVLRSGWLSMGPRTEEFEDALSAALDAPNVLAVTNGTAALHLGAAALGLEQGDEVI